MLPNRPAPFNGSDNGSKFENSNKKSSEIIDFRGFLVRVAGFEPTASWTRTMRATNCATPGWLYHYSVRNAFCQVKDYLTTSVTGGTVPVRYRQRQRS